MIPNFKRRKGVGDVRSEAAEHVVAAHETDVTWGQLPQDWHLRSEEDRHLLRETADVWAQAAFLRDSPGYTTLLGKPVLRERLTIALHQGADRLASPGGRLAMACCVPIVAMCLFYAPAVRHYRTGATGMIVTMDDGTVVSLAPRSEVAVRMFRHKRLVALKYGEADFAVKHNVSRPFSVEAGETVIRDIGTHFSVRYSSGCGQFSMEEGVAEVSGTGLLRRRMIEGEEIARVDGAADALDCVKRVNNLRFSYRDTPLKTIVSDIKKFYDHKISIASPQLDDMRLTTAFNVIQIDSMLQTLPQILPITIKRDSQGDVVLMQ